MALDNIRNEPRREIIEQAAGLAAIAAFVLLDYAIVAWIGYSNTADLVFGMVLVGVGLILTPIILAALAVVMHSIGEGVCAILGKFGADPRPEQRYRR